MHASHGAPRRMSRASLCRCPLTFRDGTQLLQGVPGITQSPVGTPFQSGKCAGGGGAGWVSVTGLCMHERFSEPSIEEAADAMCSTRENKGN
jgi:hypothetical protein